MSEGFLQLPGACPAGSANTVRIYAQRNNLEDKGSSDTVWFPQYTYGACQVCLGFYVSFQLGSVDVSLFLLFLLVFVHGYVSLQNPIRDSSGTFHIATTPEQLTDIYHSKLPHFSHNAVRCLYRIYSHS